MNLSTWRKLKTITDLSLGKIVVVKDPHIGPVYVVGPCSDVYFWIYLNHNGADSVWVDVSTDGKEIESARESHNYFTIDFDENDKVNSLYASRRILRNPFLNKLIVNLDEIFNAD